MPLRLVSGNLKPSSKTEKLDSVTPKMLRVDWSKSSPLLRKVSRLEGRSARAAAVIERLVDDVLEDLDR